MTGLTASYVTLHGAGFTDPARNPFAARAAAAARAGFTGIGVQFADLAAHGGVDAVRTVAADAGLAVTEAEFLGGWALAESVATPSDAEITLAEAARAWGPLRVTSGEFAAGPADPGRAADRLAELAARLAPLGVTLAVEAFAWGALRDYPTALDVVRRSGAPNAGVMIDIWHWFATGADTALLHDIDVREVAGVQLNDGPRVRPDDPDMLHKARSTRLLPGRGELPVRALVAELRNLGYTGPWSVEVNDPRFRALPVDEAAQRAFGSATAVLDD
ncbi:sugar phosphate isomerase/epimerase family protein [Streptomyces sp. GMR22]|uniref:sugar phosphate isomerase/epimerase family protein n=1 Tax=Streptomyces sp. GMR22 TaxID=2759524 RepID=UPI0015F9D808|nr:sugar phosphate isomerase/epimerase [Streptomyces sp. GMR22]MBA6436911.1 sugar phosphate isomerase/epimerase [Streptomyces sp. GMR22]